MSIPPAPHDRLRSLESAVRVVSDARFRGEHEGAAAAALEFAEVARRHERPIDAVEVLALVNTACLPPERSDTVFTALGVARAAIGDLQGARRAWGAVGEPGVDLVAADLGLAGVLGDPMVPRAEVDAEALPIRVALAWGAGALSRLVVLGDEAIGRDRPDIARVAFGALAELASREGEASAADRYLTRIAALGEGSAHPREIRARCGWKIRFGGDDARGEAIPILRDLLRRSVHRGDRFAQASLRLFLAEALVGINDYAAGVHAAVAHGIAGPAGYRALASRSQVLGALLGRGEGAPPASGSSPEVRVLWMAVDGVGACAEGWPSLPALDPVAHSLAALRPIPAGSRPHLVRLLAGGWRRRGVTLRRGGTGTPLVLDPLQRRLHTAAGVAEYGGSRLLFRLLGTIAVRGPDLDREALYREVWGETYRPPSSDTKLHTAVKRVRARLPEGAPVPEPTPEGGYALVGDPLVLEIDEIHPGASSGRRPAESSGLALPGGVFVGRGGLVDQVHAALIQDRAVVLHGPAGVGKSRLAAEVGQLRRGAWPAGIVLQDVTGTRHPLPALGATLGAPSDSMEALGGWLSRRGRLLWIIDGVDACPEAMAALAAICRPLAPELSLLVIRRSGAPLSGFTPIEVGLLPVDAARAMFAARARGILGRPLTPAELDHVDPTIPTNPLAIEVFASRLHQVDVSALPAAGGGPDPLADAIAGSLDGLGASDRAAMWALSVFAGPFDTDTAHRVLGVGRGSVRPLLDGLVQRSLLQRLGARWRVYDSVRSVARDQDPDADGGRRRHAHAVAARGEALVEDLDHGESPEASVLALTALRPDLETAVAFATEVDPDLGARVALVIDNLDRRRIAPSVRRTALTPHLTSIPRQNAVRLALADAAYADRDAGAVDALCNEVLASSTDPKEIGQAHLVLAQLAYSTTSVDGAADRIVERLGHIPEGLPGLKGWGLWVLGLAHQRSGKWIEAEEALSTGIALLEGARDRGGLGLALDTLATIRHAQGRWASSLALYRRSILELSRVRDLRRLRHGVHNLGNLFASLGRYAEALDQYEQAITLGQDLDDPWFVFNALANCALVQINQGALDDALARSFEAFGGVQGLRPISTVPLAYANLALTQQELGALRAAHHYLDRGDGLGFDAIPHVAGTLASRRGAVAHEEGDLDGAEVAYRRAEGILEGTAFEQDLGVLYARMGALAAQRGERSEASRCFDSARRILTLGQDVFGERILAVHQLHLAPPEEAVRSIAENDRDDRTDAELRLAIRLVARGLSRRQG